MCCLDLSLGLRNIYDIDVLTLKFDIDIDIDCDVDLMHDALYMDGENDLPGLSIL